MRDKALAAIAEYNMIGQGDRVLAGCSGGADSVALLHFLCELRAQWGLELGALHFNHRLRGEESERDEAFVRGLCRQWQLPLTVERADVKEAAKQAGESTEQCGRRLRYDFFEREAAGRSASVATAHTLSDSAETMLINLARGTALRGLAGIPPVRGIFIRPLITCTREEIERYCRENALSWVEDSSNQSDDYTRNRIRRHLLPLLAEENPRFADRVSGLLKALRADADYLNKLAAEAKDRLAQPGGSLERAGFLALDPALRGRVLASLLREAGIEADSALIDGMSAIIAAGAGSRQVSGEVMFSCAGGGFSLSAVEKERAPVCFSASFALSTLESGEAQAEVFAGKKVHLSLKTGNIQKKLTNFQKKDLTYCLDYDRIVNVVNLRGRLPGDKLRLPGRGCSKTLKNLFQEKGVGARERLGQVVLADREGVLWVEGLGPDERAAVTEKTVRALVIEISVRDVE